MFQSIIDDCGLAVTRYEAVHGGDINSCYCLFTNDAKYFLKVNDATLYPGMFQKEASGLQALNGRSVLQVPTVIKYGCVDKQQYLLMEWIEKGASGKPAWSTLGAGLATIHKHTAELFGWNEDNYIGSIPQENTQQVSCHQFFSDCRVMPLVELLCEKNIFSELDHEAALAFCEDIRDFFPLEPPSLLHGDLWSGNIMITAASQPALVDPAVYFGHREMDIGMTLLFGGFDETFYSAYNDVYPLANGWRERVYVTQLYPLLVHALLFGGGYVANVREILGTRR